MSGDDPAASPSGEPIELETLRRSQRGDRAFAGLLAISALAASAWIAHRVAHHLVVALTVGTLIGIAVYRLLTRRLRADLRTLSSAIPPWWSEMLDSALPVFRLFPERRRERFLRRLQLFLADQRITGVRCEVTDEDRLLLAGAATLMIDGLRRFRWPSHREFLIYPSAFDEGYRHDDEGSQVGELLDAGPVILSLPELHFGFTDEDWTNVAIHELAHYFDSLRSTVPGEFESEFDAQLETLLDDPKLREAILEEQSPIDDYALEDRQEFFAVCSEVFFEDPLMLRELHPRVYRWLAGVYRQDLADLVERADPSALD